MNQLSKDFEFYKSHQDELVKKYKNRFIVIKNSEILGDYSSYEEAVVETLKEHKLGSFLIQKVDGGAANFTQTFHSRVIVDGKH